MQMKRLFCLLINAVMLLSGFSALAETVGADAPAHTDTPVHILEKKDVPLIFNYELDPNSFIPLYFLDGVEDLPYVDLKEYTEQLNVWLSDSGTDYMWYEDEESGLCSITYQPNGSNLFFDFGDHSVNYSSFETFGAEPGRFLLDMLSFSGKNSVTGEPELFERLDVSSLEQQGTIRIIPLEDYGIPMLRQDGLCLMPLHTVFELTINLPCARLSCYFNGKAVFFGSKHVYVDTVRDPQTGEQIEKLTGHGKGLFDCTFSKRSPELAEYSLNELCMELDYFYGLKESHNIESFSWVTLNSGLYQRLLDENPAVADAALSDLINLYLDDLHSSFEMVSPMTGFDTELPPMRVGFSAKADEFNMERYWNVRGQAFPEGVPSYQEVGNTAFVNFDLFTVAPDLDYYSLNLDDPNCVQDTISLILYANRQIRREGSPVKNVVLDLSLNSGGRSDAAVFVTGWFIGQANITVVNTFSGAKATGVYRVDTNLDRVFDERDCLLGEYGLYCLTSPESFSAGNLLPWVFKTSGLVTLMGDTSGGGSCEVLPLTTAWGTSFNVSGFRRLSFIKNGSFYDIDRGIEPDVVFTKVSTFYDRQKVTDIINSLY